MKILIIEDDYPQALFLKMLLEEIGQGDITIVDNLESIKKATSSTRFDLILTDIRMPEADGITLLSKYLTPGMTGGVVIVSVVDDMIKELTAGMCRQLGYEHVGVISKPFNSVDLTHELNKYTSQRQNTKRQKEQIQIEQEEVLNAFHDNLITPMYQPQFSFDSCELVGVEALARLEHPQHGTLSPFQFIDVLAKENLLLELYYLMLDKCTSDMGSWQSPPQLSINIESDFLNADICEATVETCRRNGFPLEKLTLEISENSVFNPTPTSLENLARLNLYGVRFSIDDFGTGYASLDQLIDLPITELKIDRVFIANVVNNYKHQQLTLAALRLSQALGMSCVAEGIEDQDTWEYLKELGVDVCQGFYTGAPMPIGALTSLHRATSGDITIPVQNEKMDTILLFDKLQLRGTAIQRLLSKELAGTEVLLATNTSVFMELLHKYSNSFVVVNSQSFQLLPDDERASIRNLVRKMNSVLLTEPGESIVSELIIPTIEGMESVTATATKLTSHIEVQLNFKNKRNPPKLSESEQKVARLLLAGFSNKHICYELNLSPKTVSTFKTRILQKMGVKSIVELARILNL